MKTYNFIYLTVNLTNGKIYMGAHSTNDLEDGYLGSGVLLRKAIAKYGEDNFKRYIVEHLDDPYAMYSRERELVNEEFVKRRDTYNVEIGGRGGKVWTDEMKQAMSDSIKQNWPNGRPAWNKGLTKESSEIMAKTAIKLSENHADFTGDKNPMYGKPCTDFMSDIEIEDWKQKISKQNTGKKRTAEHKKNYSEAAKKRIWMVNKDGKLSHTIDEGDPRLLSDEWQRGKQWKD